MTKLTIIIATHNSSLVIEDCLKTLTNSPYPIIIIDCKSSDNTISKISQKENLTIIKSPQNLGYGKANNLAAKQADSKYLLFLNPDAVITIDEIKKVLNILDKKTDIGVGGVQIEGEKYQGLQEGNILYKNWILGAVFFIRAELFANINGFDENIFMYGDENDLCSRVEKAGFKNAVMLDVNATHINRGSTPKKWQYDYLRGFHTCWSKLYLRKKRKGLFKTAYIIPKFILKSLILALIGIITLDKHETSWYVGSAIGGISFLIGRKAFDKHNNPRGFLTL